MLKKSRNRNPIIVSNFWTTDFDDDFEVYDDDDYDEGEEEEEEDMIM